ncbi:hypothetical protein VT50_0200855 [Streptomyces antioxidans]|uniref:Uncharacterized protein n=1 Tax=Streptomyces antioxidans TaxID=1507734 RepID=A0A1V4DD42_9ACTN|nr:hypothetical protein [Streptomyces antioxidans]OPF84615.1 hypothetical protein VT50_0200855 [Streptomyces antioxidans]
MIDLGYSLSRRFPDPPQTDYRTADVRTLRYDLFCGDVYVADTDKDRELSTAWGWVPVLDFAWALCDIVERLDRDPRGSRSATAVHAELDFTESTDRMLFERRFGWVDITADWVPLEEAPLTVSHAVLRREARDFLHDLIADLVDLNEGLGDNPVVWGLQSRFPRV